MITELCKMTSIPILFHWMNHKDEELSIFKTQEELLQVQKVKKTKYKTADCKCGLLFPSLRWPCNMAGEIVRKCRIHIYSRRTLVLILGKLLWVFLQKYLWVGPEVRKHQKRSKPPKTAFRCDTYEPGYGTSKIFQCAPAAGSIVFS